MALLPFIALAASLHLAPTLRAAEPLAIPPEHHAWGRVVPGAFSVVRNTTETFNEGDDTPDRFITTTRTTLHQLDTDGVILLIEAEREIAGKLVKFDPHTVKQGFNGVVTGQDTQIADLGTADVEIEGNVYPCRMQRITITDSRTITNIDSHYCPELPPYIIKSETTTTERDGGAVVDHILMQVIATDMPYLRRSDVLSTSVVTAVRDFPQGTTHTIATYSQSVPGGLVAQVSKELDTAGQLIRRSTLELLDYSVVPRPDSPADSPPIKAPSDPPPPTPELSALPAVDADATPADPQRP